jgi:hypothetical protein
MRIFEPKKLGSFLQACLDKSMPHGCDSDRCDECRFQRSLIWGCLHVENCQIDPIIIFLLIPLSHSTTSKEYP